MPVTNVSPAKYYWGIDVDSMVYSTSAGVTVPLTTSPAKRSGIVDTGTSGYIAKSVETPSKRKRAALLLVPTDAFNAYKAAIAGAHYDSSSGLLLIPQSSIPSMGPMTLTIGGKPVRCFGQTLLHLLSACDSLY